MPFIPASTYRVQLNKDFTLRDLRGIIDYLDRLGITTIYAAPILKATPGSMHGYDVIDPHVINPEIGTLDELRDIVNELKSRNMTWLQDIVPNHMAFNTRNERLMDVLERGEQSPYYQYFDINWNHPSENLKGKVMVPFLGDDIQRCIERGEIKLAIAEDGLRVKYFETAYPLSLKAYETLALYTTADVRKFLIEFSSVQRHALSEWLKYKKEKFNLSSENKKDLEKALQNISGDNSKLLEVLHHQNYALVDWKVSDREINYRRFFTVNELICLRMEDDTVFDEYHTFLKQLYDEGLIQGLRIDHIDGLHDPSGYIRKLRKLFGNDCYIIAEKILEAKEDMPNHWPLEGTSGYEFLSYVSQLITNRKGAKELLNLYNKLVPNLLPYKDLVFAGKRFMLDNHMMGEWSNLLTLLKELDLLGNHNEDKIGKALALLMLSLPVYRIYPDELPLKGKSLLTIHEAFDKALKEGQEYKVELTHLRSLFIDAQSDQQVYQHTLYFLRRLMQFTGPLTAKGVEDTTFYVYNPLISHDEVGDAPSTLGITVANFHEKMLTRQKHTPLSLNATATHDTKRGEDARIRLNVLSEIPSLWEEQVTEWIKMNIDLHVDINGKAAPDINDEYFIYQSIIGGFPEDLKPNDVWIERLKAYITKVLREAKVNSSWSMPDEKYEAASLSFIDKLFDPAHKFISSLTPFMRAVCDYANVLSIGQTLIKLTAPGIPDTYQGCELWDLSYVDPDNRRPIDYKIRSQYLNTIKDFENEKKYESLFNSLVNKRDEGFEKIYVTYKALEFRKRNNKLFIEGDYIPVSITGKTSIAIAYARRRSNEWLVIVVPLFISKISDGEADRERFLVLPEDAPTQWKNILTNEALTIQNHVSLADVLGTFSVAMLFGKN